MRLSNSVAAVCFVGAALFAASCSDSSPLTGIGGAGGNGTDGSAGAIGADAGSAGATAGAGGAAPQQGHDAGASTNCGPMNCAPTQSYCLQKQEWNASETYACNAIPADCASNPTCDCICPDRNCAGAAYLCECSDSNGLFAVRCGF